MIVCPLIRSVGLKAATASSPGSVTWWEVGPVDRQATGAVTRPGRGSVAVEDLGFVLVPRGGGAVGVDGQGPAPAVDDDLVVEGAEQDAVARSLLKSLS